MGSPSGAARVPPSKQRNGLDHGIYELARGDLVRIAVNGTVWPGRVRYAGRH
jgi:hypothetical protein